jgi:FkbM family methyltransferase
MGKQDLIKLMKEYGLIKSFKIYKSLINPKTTKIHIPDYKCVFFLRPKTKDKDIFKHIILENDYDIKFNFEPKIIIDAGAYTGFSSVYFANKYKQAKIFAIEVDDDNYKTLLRNTKTYKNIITYNKALWYKITKLKIINVDVNKCSITVEEDLTDAKTPTITINEIINDNNIDVIDILKIDIEGAEKELFENNSHSWLSKIKILIIELHDRKKEGCSKAVFEAMLKYNFSTEVKSEYIIFHNLNV